MRHFSLHEQKADFHVAAACSKKKKKKRKESEIFGIQERSVQAGIFTFVREDAISGMGLPVEGRSPASGDKLKVSASSL